MTRDEHIAQAQECAAHIEVMRAELRRDMRGPGLTAEDIQASAALISAVAAHGQLHAQIAQALAAAELADRPQIWPAGATVVHKQQTATLVVD